MLVADKRPIIDRRRTWEWIATGALVSVVLRLRMLGTPVTSDEGGYLAIARGWAHGRVLYRDVWVDRPQGLLALFRVWDWISGGHTGSIRIMAMLFGILLVASTAVVVREVVGHRAARWTAIICGVVSAAPVLEAHTANGELLSGAVSAAGIAVAVIGLTKPEPLRWLFGSGLLAGAALSLKQSGFDGLLGLLLWFALIGIFAPKDRRLAVRSSLAIIAGVASVIGVLMIHGAVTGWYRWWWAVAGYRFRTQSVLANAQWFHLIQTAPFALVVLGSSLMVALVVAVRDWEHRRRSMRAVLVSRAGLLPLWLMTSCLSFLIGGGYWRHYWLLLAAPVSALGGVALARAGRFTSFAAAVALVPCLAISTWVYVGDSSTVTVRATADRRSQLDEKVAAWFVANRKPGDNLYALCVSSAVYADANQDPGFPYLWFPEVYAAPNAQKLLLSYLSDPVRAPKFIAQYQAVSSCDRTGRLDTILKTSYRQVSRIGFAIILQRKP